MPRLTLAAAAVLLAAGPAPAVIKKLTPLKEVIDGTESILVAEVAKIDPDRPSAVFAHKEDLKGKSAFDTFPVNLAGDSFAKKDNHTKAMLDRLSPGRRLILFATKDGKTHTVFGFLEGTWFQVQGTTDADGKTVRWAFLHCEPYFRRTFKGTTAELHAVVQKAVAGTAAPPGPDEKEPPGYGPLPEKKSLLGRPGGLFAVIPSFVLVGPLAVVAALFPAVFARLAAQFTRWRAFLVVASANGTAALAYYWLRGYLPDAPAVAEHRVSLYLLVVAAGGLAWAGWRYRRLAATDPAVTAPPSRAELLTLLGLTAFAAAAVGVMAWLAGGRRTAVEQPLREFTAVAAGLLAATGYAAYRAMTQRTGGGPVRLSLSGESVALAGLIAFGTAALAAAWPDGRPGGTAGELGDAVAAAVGPRLAAVTVFPIDDAHEVLSRVAVGPDGRLYFGTLKTTGFAASGSVCCADPATGRVVWRFNDDGAMKPVFCAPTVAGDRVFVGEGLHTDSDRRLFALDAKTGTPVWAVTTTSHTEGSPAVVGGRVYFSAGDDGLYCVTAADGKEVWHVRGREANLHVDTPPVVAGRRVFFGSGYGTLAILCADADTGAEVWRTPVNLRSFGRPAVRGDRVYVGLGTGDLANDVADDEATPAGALVCLDATTGVVVWRAETPKSVHTAVAIDARTVYACCKDGTVHALARDTGGLRWKRAVGGEFAAGPAVAGYANGATTVGVYVVSADGVAACLDPATGAPFWVRDLGESTKQRVRVVSPPVVVPTADGAGRTVYFGGELRNANTGARTAAVFKVEDVVED